MNEQKDIHDLDEKIKDAHAKAGLLTEEEKLALEKRQNKVIKASASAGLEFAAAIIFATIFGIWLDKQLSTAPIFMMIFIILGGVVAFYNLYRASENLDSSSKDANSQLHSTQKEVKKTPTKNES